MSRGDDLAEVELVEDRPDARVVPRWVPIVLAVLLVLGVVAVVVVHRIGQQRRAAELADLGFARTLTDPMREAWTVDGASVLAADRSTVYLQDEQLRAVAADTGTQLWAQDVVGDCAPVADGTVAFNFLVADVTGTSLLLWCDGEGPDGDVEQVVDSAGTTVARFDVPGNAVLSTVIDSDLVQVWQEPDGHLGAARWSLADGAERWHTTTPDVVFGDSGATTQLDANGTLARITALRVVVLDLRTGEEVDPGAPGTVTGVEPAPHGRTVGLAGGLTARQIDGAGRLPQVEVLAADGSQLYQVSGAIGRPVRDDGSALDVLVVQSGGVLSGLDALTGDRRWAYNVGVQPEILADGVLVARGSSIVVGIDMTDGSVLWQHDDEASVFWDMTSDGALLATVEPGADGPEVVARGLRDDRVRWQVPLPDGAAWAAVLPDGSLAVASGSVGARIGVLRSS
jgi:outer membrane protein assembly factor BamB